MRIHGIAYRQGGDDHEWLGEDVEVPDEVPCTVNFDHTKVIGPAKLSRDEAGNIIADVDVRQHGHLVAHVEVDEVTQTHLWPVLAVSIQSPNIEPIEDGLFIRTGRILGVALSMDNNDHGIPPYEVVIEDK